MQMDGEAVQQTLTAVWCAECATCGNATKEGNDLEEVERVAGMGVATVRPPSGSSAFVVVGAAGVAPRHAAVIIVGRFHRPA